MKEVLTGELELNWGDEGGAREWCRTVLLARASQGQRSGGWSMGVGGIRGIRYWVKLGSGRV